MKIPGESRYGFRGVPGFFGSKKNAFLLPACWGPVLIGKHCAASLVPCPVLGYIVYKG